MEIRNRIIPKELVSKELPYHVHEIDPKIFYKKSQLSYCKDNDDRSVYAYISKQEKAGLINHVPYINKINGGKYKSHLWYGQDILNLLQFREDKEKGIESSPINPEQSIIEKIVEISTKKDIAHYIKQAIDLQSENTFLQEHIKRIQKDYSDLLQNNEELLCEFEKEINIENKIKKKVINFLLNKEEKVYWFELSLEDTCGVYLLKMDNEIVYIGQSVSVPNRVIQHAKDGKEFNKVTIIPCPKKELDDKEMFLIRLIKPPLNGHYKNSTDERIIEYQHGFENGFKNEKKGRR